MSAKAPPTASKKTPKIVTEVFIEPCRRAFTGCTSLTPSTRASGAILPKGAICPLRHAEFCALAGETAHSHMKVRLSQPYRRGERPNKKTATGCALWPILTRRYCQQDRPMIALSLNRRGQVFYISGHLRGLTRMLMNLTGLGFRQIFASQ
jgi:hypothetical protein